MTFIESKIARSAKMLARWQGMPARLQGPEGLAVKCVRVIVGVEPGKNLVVSCIDPSVISGPRESSNSHVILSPIKVDDGDEGVELIDEANGVRIVSGTFEVREEVKLKEPM